MKQTFEGIFGLDFYKIALQGYRQKFNLKEGAPKDPQKLLNSKNKLSSINKHPWPCFSSNFACNNSCIA